MGIFVTFFSPNLASTEFQEEEICKREELIAGHIGKKSFLSSQEGGLWMWPEPKVLTWSAEKWQNWWQYFTFWQHFVTCINLAYFGPIFGTSYLIVSSYQNLFLMQFSCQGKNRPNPKFCPNIASALKDLIVVLTCWLWVSIAFWLALSFPISCMARPALSRMRTTSCSMDFNSSMRATGEAPVNERIDINSTKTAVQFGHTWSCSSWRSRRSLAWHS